MTSVRVADRNHMTSFYFRTIGRLAGSPELVTSEQGAYYRFCVHGDGLPVRRPTQSRLSRGVDRNSTARKPP